VCPHPSKEGGGEVASEQLLRLQEEELERMQACLEGGAGGMWGWGIAVTREDDDGVVEEAEEEEEEEEEEAMEEAILLQMERCCILIK